MRFDAGPRPTADLPAARLCVEDECCLAFFSDGFAVLFVEIDGGDDDVGEVAFDFGACGSVVLYDAVGDACCCCVLFVVGCPCLRGVGAGPSVGRKFVDDGDVVFFVGCVGGGCVTFVEAVDVSVSSRLRL
ncbi:hypothetical protein [Tunturiibacter psychrotolerans]|uniref:hypothetical protein n=1 Tax=Tunturiibacter psychrotolerans TaxID=3069686 RepID=UPI003D24E20C